MRSSPALVLILVLGFALRFYNLNFPSIGYHNMIENEYLSMAQEMQRTQDYITKRVYFYNALDANPVVTQDIQPPLVSYQTLISWKALGENLWAPRLFNVIFGVLSILVIYFIALQLFNNINLSLFSAFILAVLPLGVFFSRNIQPESPGFFFMLLGNLCYLKFCSSLKKYQLFLGGLFFTIAWLYRFNFLIGVLPFIFCFPFRRIANKKKALVKYALTFFLSYVFLIIAFFWVGHLWPGKFQQQIGARLLDIFSFSYWNRYGAILSWYAGGENFTVIFFVTSLLGIMLAFLKAESLLDRYIIGWALAILPYGIIFSQQIAQQNFAQMAFLGLVCIASSHTISFVAETFKKILKKDLLILFMVIIGGVSLQFVYGSLYRMHATVFLGADAAGETLRELTTPQERIFLLTHAQGYAIARYAQRYAGWPSNFEDFINKEKEFKIRYICIYPVNFWNDLKSKAPKLFAYVRHNYRIKELGYEENINRIDYLILEKGKGSNLENSLNSFTGSAHLKTIYRLFGRYIFFYAVKPAAKQAAGNKQK
jgi:4-amino-4-deoxy-L-arabinose transferase-like glycosyltransferase